MTDQVTAASPARLKRRRPRPRVPRLSISAIIWLTIVWVMLWGDLTLGNFVAGLGLATFVTLVMPMPRNKTRMRIRPLGLIILITVFLKDVVVASFQIAWMVIRGIQPRQAVIRCQLRTHSDLVLSITSGLCSLVPGSIVVDAHRVSGVIYLHILDVEMSGGMDGAHRLAIDQEERLIRAIGTDDQLIDAGYVPSWSRRAGRLKAPTVTGAAADAPSREDRDDGAGLPPGGAT